MIAEQQRRRTAPPRGMVPVASSADDKNHGVDTEPSRKGRARKRSRISSHSVSTHTEPTARGMIPASGSDSNSNRVNKPRSNQDSVDNTVVIISSNNNNRSSSNNNTNNCKSNNSKSNNSTTTTAPTEPNPEPNGVLPSRNSKVVSPVSHYNDDGVSFDHNASVLGGSNLSLLEHHPNTDNTLPPEGSGTDSGNPYADLSGWLLELEGCLVRANQPRESSLANNHHPAVLAVLRRIHRCVVLPASDEPSRLRLREECLAAVLDYGGIPLVFRLVRDERERRDRLRTQAKASKRRRTTSREPLGGDTNNTTTEVVTLCLEILRDACCLPAEPLGAPPPSRDTRSASEQFALELVKQESGLETLAALATSSLRDSIPLAGEKPTKTSKKPPPPIFRLPKILPVVWGIFANLTYFASVTEWMGTAEVWRLADLAEWAVAALDCGATHELQRCLPSPTQEASPATTQPASSTKKRARKRTPAKPTASAAVAAATLRQIASEASIALVPVLGTIRNLVADPLVTPAGWETRCLVSKLLDVVGKGHDDEEPQHGGGSDTTTHTNRPTPPRAEIEHWLHFVKKTFGTLRDDRTEGAATAAVTTATTDGTGAVVSTAAPTVFRWMEQDERTVWELLGVFKVCLGKGILSDAHDVERLASLWIRCLKRFGDGSSDRIVLRVVGLARGLVDAASGAGSCSATVRKQILLRGGLLDELHLLLGASSGNSTVRTEIEGMIASFREKSPIE